MASITPSPAQNTVSVIEKIALGFLAKNPDILAKFLAQGIGDLLKKKSVDPAIITELTTDVQLLVDALIPSLVSSLQK